MQSPFLLSLAVTLAFSASASASTNAAASAIISTPAPGLKFSESDAASSDGSSQIFYKKPSTELRLINFQVSPVATLARRYNAAVDFGLSERFALGPKGTWYKNSSQWIFESVQGYEVGLRGSFYVTDKRFRSGLVLRPSLMYGRWKEKADFAEAIANSFTQGIASAFGGNAVPTTFRDTVDGPVVQAVVAYQATLDSGFNLDLGGGLQGCRVRHQVINLATGETADYKEASVTVSPLIEFNVGWAF